MARKPVSYLAGSVLLGTAIGTVVGLLTAPRSGENLRKMLSEGAQDLNKRARERLDEARHTLPERLPEALRRRRGWRITGGDGDRTQVTVEGAHAADETQD